MGYLNRNKVLMTVKILIVINSLLLVVDANPVIQSFEDQWNYKITPDKTPILSSESARDNVIQKGACTTCKIVAELLREDRGEQNVTDKAKSMIKEACELLKLEKICGQVLDTIVPNVTAMKNWGVDACTKMHIFFGEDCKMEEETKPETATTPDSSSNSSEKNFNFFNLILFLVWTKIITVKFLHF